MTPAEILAEFRRELARRDTVRARELAAAFAALWLLLRVRLDAMIAAVELARAEGRSVLAALYERERLAALEVEVTREIARITGRTVFAVQQEQRLAATLGADAARRLLAEQGVTLPVTAIEAMVANLTRGSALQRLLSSLAPMGWEWARDALLEAVALGRNPREIARAVRDALNVPLTRALTISRTEILRAFRDAQLEQYQRTGVVQGWVWVAALDNPRTCPACVALHGRWFPLTEPMSEHPNGRCSQAPALGFPDTDGYYRQPPFDVTGPEWFAGLPAAVQREILGPSKWAAYVAGQISLADLVSVRYSASWGVTRSVASLAEALARAGERAA